MMKSKKSYKPLNLDCDLTTSAEDIFALRRARRDRIQNLSTYLRFLSGLHEPSISVLGARKGPTGSRPFEL
jgi:hypothetical protein